MKKIIKSISLILMLLILMSSCGGDYLDRSPSAYISPETLYSDVDKAKLAINGMARLMVSKYSDDAYGQFFCGEGTIKYLNEYMSETYSRPALASGWVNTMSGNRMDSNTSGYTTFAWYYYYTIIANANEFLSATIGNAEGNEKTIEFLRAQALVFRAYSYMQLVQLYCSRWVDGKNDVAELNNGLVLRTEENIHESDVPMSSAKDIYTQIYKDLDKAIELFVSSGKSRSKVWEPNQNVAYATYARAALNRQDYGVAAEMAAKARNGYPLMSNSDYMSGFSKENNEWIWGSYGDVDQTLSFYGFHSYMAYDANTSVIRTNPICISKTLYNKIPATDIRKGMFLDPPAGIAYSTTDGRYSTSKTSPGYAFAQEIRTKYSSMTADHRVSAYHSFKFSIGGGIGIGYINNFRSSEMYLIEAEAKYFLGGAEDDIRRLMNELIRDSKRDEAYDCTSAGEDLLKEIKFYRDVELWGEGFNWFDKKRYNEPIVRKSFANGGSFHSVLDGTTPVGYKNGWVYVTPLYESENNNAIGSGN